MTSSENSVKRTGWRRSEQRERQRWQRNGPQVTNWVRGVILRDPCAYCGKRRSKRHPMTADHIVPAGRGASGTMDNLTAACFACNNAKGDESLLLFLLERLS